MSKGTQTKFSFFLFVCVFILFLLLCPGNYPALTSSFVLYMLTYCSQFCQVDIVQYLLYTSTVGWVKFYECKKECVGVAKCQKEPKLTILNFKTELFCGNPM